MVENLTRYTRNTEITNFILFVAIPLKIIKIRHEWQDEWQRCIATCIVWLELNDVDHQMINFYKKNFCQSDYMQLFTPCLLEKKYGLMKLLMRKPQVTIIFRASNAYIYTVSLLKMLFFSQFWKNPISLNSCTNSILKTQKPRFLFKIFHTHEEQKPINWKQRRITSWWFWIVETET